MRITHCSISATITSVALASLVALAAGCASRPAIRLDKDPAADLTTYKTFAFFEPAAIDRPGYATILSKRLKNATRLQLEKQNYAYSEHDPDLRVNLILNVVDKVELHSMPVVHGRYGYRSWAGGVETVAYRQGTLMIDLVDARKNALVWQAVAEGRITEQAVKSPGPAIDQVVGEMFSDFPNGETK